MSIEQDAMKIAQNYGIQNPNGAVLSKIALELQSNPDLLSQSMGLQGGAGGESGSGGGGNRALLEANLNKLAADTSHNTPSVTSEASPSPPMNPGNSPAPVAPVSGRSGNGSNGNSSSVSQLPSTRTIPTSIIDNRGGGLDINAMIPPPGPDTPPPTRGPQDTTPPQESLMTDDPGMTQAPMTKQEFAMAVGIPLSGAAVGYALYQKLAALDGKTYMHPDDLKAINIEANDPSKLNRLDDLYPNRTGPEYKAKLQAEIDAENGKKPVEKAVDKLAADTAKPKRAIPRTAVPGVPANSTPIPDGMVGPVRNATVVDDGTARAEKAESDRALREAQKPQVVPPAKPDNIPVESIKDSPYSKPVDPNALQPQGPIEPMNQLSTKERAMEFLRRAAGIAARTR